MLKIFTKDKFFLTVTVLAVLGELLFAVVEGIAEPELLNVIIMSAVSAVCTLVLYCSYKKHNKNAMKAVMGGLLMSIFAQYTGSLSNGIADSDNAIALILALASILLFFSHISLNSNRKANAFQVYYNQILIIVIAIIEIIWDALWIANNNSALITVGGLAVMIGNSCVLAAVVCVESRLDAYRQDREAAGWTEEKGYPEGYVHEYQKNK